MTPDFEGEPVMVETSQPSTLLVAAGDGISARVVLPCDNVNNFFRSTWNSSSTGDDASLSFEARVAMEDEDIEADEWEQACRMQAEFDEGSCDAPSGSTAHTETQQNTFQAAKKFDGMRSGMEFKKGVDGLGYYPTRPSIILLAHDLAIPTTTHHPVKLELDKLFPTDDDIRMAMTAPNKK